MKFLLGKISAVGMILVTSMIVTGCETTAGKPEICKSQKDVRCAKVKPVKNVNAASAARSRADAAGKGMSKKSKEY